MNRSREKKTGNTSQEEAFLISQSAEINVGENTVWARKFRAFPALQDKNYRIYFFGQFVSVIGTWLQIVAQGWLVLQLAQSAFLIGLVTALATLPSLLFSLFGGVIVDRFPKKKILFFTQSANMVLAITFGVLTATGTITIPLVCLLAFSMGTVNAVDAPARQAFVSELVDREKLASAIALNSAIFNAGRVIGPGLAGFLIAAVGTGGAFIINGVSYFAVIVALWFLTVAEKPATGHLSPFKAIREGIRYAVSHPIIRVLLIFAGVVSVFGWSYSTMMPVIAQNTFGLQARGLGYLYAATGLGSLLATILVGLYSQKVSPLYFIVGGNTLFAVSLMLFSFTRSLPAALALLFFTGLGLLLQAATMNTTIQRLVKSDFRGRVMSIYILMFLGLAPVGNFEVGFLTEKLGTSWAISLNAAVVLIFGGIVLVNRQKIRAAYAVFKQENPVDEG
jgi:MFS family permease